MSIDYQIYTYDSNKTYANSFFTNAKALAMTYPYRNIYILLNDHQR